MTARPSRCRRRRRCVWRWQTPGALAPLPAKLRCEELLKGTGHSASPPGPSFSHRRLGRAVSSSFAGAAMGCTALPCARCRCAADGVFEGTEEGARRRWRQHPKPGHWPLGLALRRRRVEVIKKSAWRTQPPAARQLVMVEGGAGGDGVVLIVNLRNIHESVIELQAPAWSPVPAPRGRKVPRSRLVSVCTDAHTGTASHCLLERKLSAAVRVAGMCALLRLGMQTLGGSVCIPDLGCRGRRLAKTRACGEAAIQPPTRTCWRTTVPCLVQ